MDNRQEIEDFFTESDLPEAKKPLSPEEINKNVPPAAFGGCI